MEKAPFLPILLGSDENAYGNARLFYDEYGIKPLLLCSRPLPPTSYSRILSRRVIKDFDNEAVFRGIMEEFLPILKNEAEHILVIPCSDYYAELVIKNRALIKKYSDTPAVTEELYQRFSDKPAFYRLCEEMKLPYPKTLILTAEEILNTSLPFESTVIKPSNSNSFSYLHLEMDKKKKVYFCKTDDEVRKTAESFLSVGYRDPLVVQHYVEGGRSLVVNAYCDKNAKVRLIGAAEPILEYRAAALIGNYAALKTVVNREVCNRIIKFLEDIGYVGFANFDLKFDEKRNEYVFFELNPRQGRSSYYLHTAGKNLMKTLCDDVVLNTKYSGVEYAEEEGVWRNVPRLLLKSLVSHPLSNNTRTDSAITYLSDFSLMRAYTLIKRDIAASRLFKES